MRCRLGYAETQASGFDPRGGEGASGGVRGWSVFAVLSNTFAQAGASSGMAGRKLRGETNLHLQVKKVG